MRRVKTEADEGVVRRPGGLPYNANWTGTLVSHGVDDEVYAHADSQS
jgi:hypothetical protein